MKTQPDNEGIREPRRASVGIAPAKPPDPGQEPQSHDAAPRSTNIALPEAVHARRAGQHLYIAGVVNLAASVGVLLLWIEHSDQGVPVLHDLGLTCWFLFDFTPVLAGLAAAAAIKHLKHRAWAIAGIGSILPLIGSRTVEVQWLATLPFSANDPLPVLIGALCLVSISLSLLTAFQAWRVLRRPKLWDAFH